MANQHTKYEAAYVAGYTKAIHDSAQFIPFLNNENKQLIEEAIALSAKVNYETWKRSK